jgi:hypothetical protein
MAPLAPARPKGGLRPAQLYGMRTSLAVERTATGGMAQ